MIERGTLTLDVPAKTGVTEIELEVVFGTVYAAPHGMVFRVLFGPLAFT
jgi:hypothetical protein